MPDAVEATDVIGDSGQTWRGLVLAGTRSRDRASVKLSYALNNMPAAVVAIGEELNNSDAARWRAMTLTDERASQTYKALGIVIGRAQSVFTRKKAELVAFKGSSDEYREAKTAYLLWRSRNLYFVSVANARRAELKERVTRTYQDAVIRSLVERLNSLQRGIAEHRDSVRGGSRPEVFADRILWDQMDISVQKENAS